MKLVVTILEKTFDAALDAIRGIALDHDAVELRAEELGAIDLGRLRNATQKPLILTHRGRPIDEAAIRRAVDAGIDLVDVELDDALDEATVGRYAERIVLSHHDFASMPDFEALVDRMRRFRCAHVKIAVTPRTIQDNLRLLALLDAPGRNEKLTVIGMGEHGLYSRILAPFRGSELTFVAPDDSCAAAPGQITLGRALEIYGPSRERLHASYVFAIAGNPAGHSISPAVHNALFREKGVDAAYTVASFESFSDILHAFEARALSGMSITAPFKEEAFAYAGQNGVRIRENGCDGRSINTLVNTRNGVIADNTDVDGFERLLREIADREHKRVALIGAGGTARAALVALRREAMSATVFNRSEQRGSRLAAEFGVRFEPLSALPLFQGEVVINTLPPPADMPLKLDRGSTYIQAAYGDAALAARCEQLKSRGVQVFDGLDLVHAQAVRQNEIFTEAIH